MLLRQIEYFVSVVETGSFTEAAEQCYISQSAISQQVQALENTLGVTLLQRGNRRFTVTPAGEYFFEQGKQLLKEASHLQQETIRIARKEHPTLSLAYLSVYSGSEFRRAVAAFTACHSDVDIQVRSGTHEELYDMLLSGKVDLALSDPRRAFSEDYVNRPLFAGYCYAECAEHGAFSGAEKVTLDDLKTLPCVLVSSVEQRKNEQAYYEKTLGFGGRFLFAENLEEARMLVIAGKGFLPVLETVDVMPQIGGLIRRLPLYKGDAQIKRSYYLFWPKERTNALVTEFAKLLEGYFGKETE